MGLKSKFVKSSFMMLVLKKGASKKEIEILRKKLERSRSSKGVDTKKYCGAIKLKKDPEVIQKKMRDEWE